jgi:hypothetical protein
VDKLNHVLDFSALPDHVGRLISFVQSLNGLALVVILLVPILITALTRQVLPTLMVLLFSFASLMLFVAPNSTLTTILGIAGTVGCYFVALHTVTMRRYFTELNGQIGTLASRVAHLESAEQHRLLVELKRRQPPLQSEVVQAPREGTQEAIPSHLLDYDKPH